MRLIRILGLLLILPTIAVAEEPDSGGLSKDFDSETEMIMLDDLYQQSSFKPFIEYRINLISHTDSSIEYDGEVISETQDTSINNNKAGNFILGVEYENVAALSIEWQSSIVKTKGGAIGTSTVTTDWFATELDIYIGRQPHFKPFLHLDIGYMSFKDGFEASGIAFGFGIGCRQYITNDIFLSANLTYQIIPQMDVHDADGVDADISGFGLSLGIGYRF